MSLAVGMRRVGKGRVERERGRGRRNWTREGGMNGGTGR